MAQIHDSRETTPSLFHEAETQKAAPEKPQVSAVRAARLRRIARNGNKIVVLLEALYKDLLAETPERFRGMERSSARMGDAREDYSKAHERASFFAKSNAEYAERQLKAAGEPVSIERKRREQAVAITPLNDDNGPTLLESYEAEILVRSGEANPKENDEPWQIARL